MSGTLSIEESNRLIEQEWPRISILVRTFWYFSRRIDDPVGVASLGLVIAGRTFVPGRCSFRTWAGIRVRSELRDAAWQGRRKGSSRPVLKTRKLTSDLGDPRPSATEAIDAKDEVERILRGISGKRAEAIRVFLSKSLTGKNIGPQIGLSETFFEHTMREIRKNPYRQPIGDPLAPRR